MIKFDSKHIAITPSDEDIKLGRWKEVMDSMIGLPGGPIDEHPESKECWQYMGTQRESPYANWYHCYRHRDRSDGSGSTHEFIEASLQFHQNMPQGLRTGSAELAKKTLKSRAKKWVSDVKKIHGSKTFDLSLAEKEYQSLERPVTVTCKIHDHKFSVQPRVLVSKNRKSCCKKDPRLKLDNFLIRAKKMWGDQYDYSMIESISGSQEKVPIICKNHGVFYTQVSKHINADTRKVNGKGSGCPDCMKKSNSGNFKSLTKEQFVEKARSIHGNRYDYSESHYTGMRNRMQIRCVIHNAVFSQTASGHVKKNSTPCPICRNEKRMSDGAFEIFDFLQSSGIEFEREKSYSDLVVTDKPLRYDFFIPSINVLIEFDGEQHFKPIRGWGGKQGLEKRQLYDMIKSQYAAQNNITLHRIRFDENIEDRLSEILDI